MKTFQNPDRIVLGAVDARSHEWMVRLYAPFHDAQIILTNTRTAEMIKYASNALLATLISFSNEIGNLCSAAPDVDVVDVLGAVHLDKRISPLTPDRGRITPSITAYLKAGCGFGGSCFPKDVRALDSMGSGSPAAGAPPDLRARDQRQQQHGEVVALLKKHFPSLAGIRVSGTGAGVQSGDR